MHCRKEVEQLLKTKLKYRDLSEKKRIEENYYDKLRILMTLFPVTPK